MGLFSKLFGTRAEQDTVDPVPPGASAREVIEIALRCVREEKGGNCATLEVESNKDLWAQVMAGTFNCHYPHKEDPALRFPALFGRGLVASLDDFNPGGYMMISLREVDAAEAAAWLADYFTEVQGVDLASARLRLRMEFL